MRLSAPLKRPRFLLPPYALFVDRPHDFEAPARVVPRVAAPPDAAARRGADEGDAARLELRSGNVVRAVRYGLDLDFYTAGRDYAREVLNRADFSRPTAGIGPLPLGESSSSRAPGALGEHPRVHGTVAAIERELMVDDLVLRYRTEENVDGLPPGEGAFLACTFWLADAYAMMGRYGDAERIFEHLLSIRNDLGLLAEEYDPRARRQLGNFPQGFSHVALINTANNLISRRGPAEQRAERDHAP